MGGVRRSLPRPGKAMPEQQQPGRTELQAPGKGFTAHRELQQEQRRPGTTAIMEPPPEAKATAVGPRALLALAQRRSQRRRRRDPLRDTTAKAPVHHRMTCGLILVGIHLS